ncbi:hypothetical protein V2G26_007379 [Clonostachys chloroleuca]
MASIPPAPDPAVAVAYKVSEDIELYIRVDEAEREQPVDCTYRPTKKATSKYGTRFDPFPVEPIRKLQIKELPLIPFYTNYGLPADKYISSHGVYILIGTLIYMGNHREKRVRDYWGTSKPGLIKPIYPIARFMSYETFEQLYHAFRPYDPRGSYDGSFARILEWSEAMQVASLRYWTPASNKDDFTLDK